MRSDRQSRHALPWQLSQYTLTTRPTGVCSTCSATSSPFGLLFVPVAFWTSDIHIL